MTARPLPRRQRQVLDFIRTELSAGREFPSPAAIAFEIGWRGDTCAREALQALSGFGHLSRRNVRGRWVYALPPASPSPAAPPPGGLAKSDTFAAAVLGDDLDAGRFEGRADGRDTVGGQRAAIFEPPHRDPRHAGKACQIFPTEIEKRARGLALPGGECVHAVE